MVMYDTCFRGFFLISRPFELESVDGRGNVEERSSDIGWARAAFCREVREDCLLWWPPDGGGPPDVVLEGSSSSGKVPVPGRLLDLHGDVGLAGRSSGEMQTLGADLGRWLSCSSIISCGSSIRGSWSYGDTEEA